MTKQELFSYVHSKLGNIIKCVFGVLNACFLIMKRREIYPLCVKQDITVACDVIYKCLQKIVLNDTFFKCIREGNGNQ